MEFRILVSGSRKGMPSEVYDKVLEMIPYHENYVLIHGDASGVDKQFAQIVAKQGWRIESYPADWSLGKKAGLLRNQVMVDSGIDFGIFLPIEDTLRYNITSGKKLEKAKIILANEPMGLKNLTYDDCCDKIKELNIKGTKAEPLFLQLFMQILDDNGRCAVVVPDGVLFNESKLHKDTRKHLIENFNLQKVINLDGDFF